MPEIHPYANYVNVETKFMGGFIPKESKKVIIGTFPPENEYLKKGDGFFYYASERNHLWNTMDNIHSMNLKKTARKNADESYLQNRGRKMQFCRNKGIGFIDVFTSVNRRFIGATADVDLIPVENIIRNGVFENLIATYEIERICCVYTLAYEILLQELRIQNAIIIEKPHSYAANNIIHFVAVFGKSFEIVLLYPATRSRYKTIQKDFQYDYFLFR